jgi:hypothetical protein
VDVSLANGSTRPPDVLAIADFVESAKKTADRTARAIAAANDPDRLEDDQVSLPSAIANVLSSGVDIPAAPSRQQLQNLGLYLSKLNKPAAGGSQGNGGAGSGAASGAGGSGAGSGGSNVGGRGANNGVTFVGLNTTKYGESGFGGSGNQGNAGIGTNNGGSGGAGGGAAAGNQNFGAFTFARSDWLHFSKLQAPPGLRALGDFWRGLCKGNQIE